MLLTYQLIEKKVDRMSLFLNTKDAVHKNIGMIYKRITTNRSMNTDYKVDNSNPFVKKDAFAPVSDSWDMENPIYIRYTKKQVENYSYNDNGEKTMQRSNIIIRVNDNIDWSKLINSKVKLDDGQLYMLKSVNKSINELYTATNLLGASQNFEYDLTLA